MTIEDLFLAIILEDGFNEKKPVKEIGHFVELVFGFLSHVSKQSLRCTTKFFYTSISPEAAGCYHLKLSHYFPSVLCVSKCVFQNEQLFCGEIYAYDEWDKKTFVLATLNDFLGSPRKTTISLIRGYNQGCVSIKTVISEDLEILKETYTAYPKKNLYNMTIYYVYRLDDFHIQPIKRIKLY